MDSSIKEKHDLFRKELQKFIAFTEDEWQLFAGYIKLVTLKKRAHFVQEGKVCNQIAFIVDGSVRYYYIKDGEEITGYFSFEREFTSSYNSF